MSAMDARGEDQLGRWRRRALVAWALVGACALFVLAVRGLGLVGQAVELLAVGAIIGFICSPITNWLEDHHVPRKLGALVALVVVVVALVCALAIVVGPLASEFFSLMRNVPSYIDQIQEAVERFWAFVGSTESTLLRDAVNSLVALLQNNGATYATSAVQQLTSGLVGNVTELANHAVTFFLGLVLAFWFAADYPKIMGELAVIAGPRHDEDVILTLAVLSRSVGGYMRGTLITSAANGLLVGVGLALLGNSYAVLLGIVTFVMHFVPVIGPAVSAVLAVVVSLFSGLSQAVWALVVMVVAQNVADNLLSPVVLRSAVKIHPVLSLVGIVVGGCLGGVVGMILAVPTTAAIKSLFVYHFEGRTGRQVVSRDGALFQGTPYLGPDGRPAPGFDALDDDSFLADSRLFSSLAGVGRAHGTEAPDAEEVPDADVPAADGPAPDAAGPAPDGRPPLD